MRTADNQTALLVREGKGGEGTGGARARVVVEAMVTHGRRRSGPMF